MGLDVIGMEVASMNAEATITIRKLTVDELPRCESFARAFYVEKQIPGAFTMDRFLATWTHFLTSAESALFGLWVEGELVGGLGALITPDLYDGRMTATELFWYVTPEARNGLHAWKLVEAFEAWGEAHYVDEYRLTHILLPGEDPSTVRLAPLYKRKKYRAIEVNYLKRARGGV
jgi:hypothetical protein